MENDKIKARKALEKLTEKDEVKVETAVDNVIDINPSDIIHGKWYDFKRALFVDGGQFYEEALRFQVQAATVRTIKYFAAMDENNLLSVKDAVYKLIGTHIRVFRGNTLLNSLDVIHEHDQLRAILIINMYTGTGSKLSASVVCNGDATKRCNTTNAVDVSLKNISYTLPTEKGYTLLNKTKGSFVIEPKSVKKLEWRPLTLSQSMKLIEFTTKRLNAGDSCEQQFTELSGFYLHKMKDSDELETIYDKYIVDTNDIKLLSIMLHIVEVDINITQKMELLSTCSKCGRLNNNKIVKLGNIKHIFFTSDASDEY